MEDQQVHEPQEKKDSNSPNVLKIIIIIGVLLVITWFSLNGTGKSKEPNYELAAQSFSQLFIKENYFSNVKFPTQRYNIVSQGRRYDVSGKFDRDGTVHTFECIGEFPMANTKQYNIEYLAVDNNIVFDIVGK
ncbi:MAG: hypothetical protein IJV30_01890 [Oscillospiraceae bacterium]|nr:hypothetical protein [Oscillospiraceae bacterium]